MKKTLLGLSWDKRTNRWLMECDCGKRFEPSTTMCRFQVVTCPKCGKEKRVDYNDDNPNA